MATFYTKAGWLTPYALACGYIHKTETKDRTIILERLSCDIPSFCVEIYQRGFTGAVTSYGAKLRDGIEYREVFPTIAEARQAYAARVVKLARRFEPASDVQRNVIV